MTHILYLAAGNARRFGSNKLLAMLNGKPVFLYGLERLMALKECRTDCTVTVVSRTPEILTAATALGAHTVESPQSEKGISYTIRAGLASIEPLQPTDSVMFVLADQPWLTADSVNKLLDAAQTGCFAATAAYRETDGSPTLFSAQCLPAFQKLEGDQGGRRILKQHPEKVVRVQLQNPQELWDVDQPEDLGIHT